MTNYRLYRLDGTGRITSAEWIEASDDADARAKAQEQCDSARFELWDRKRLVHRVGEGQQ